MMGMGTMKKKGRGVTIVNVREQKVDDADDADDDGWEQWDPGFFSNKCVNPAILNIG
jgi:hypothetical protein